MKLNHPHDPRGSAETKENAADMLRGHVEFAGDLAEVRRQAMGLPQGLNARDKMGVQIEASRQDREYSNWNQMVKENIPHGTGEAPRRRMAIALKDLRNTLGFSQAQMAATLKVSQGQIAKWEGQQQTPPGQALALVAKLAPPQEQGYWLDLAGLGSFVSRDKGATRSIPLLRDAAAAGTPRAIEESVIEQNIELPKAWLPVGGSLTMLRVSGDSMSPILLDGHVVVVNTSSRDPKKLIHRMVAARDNEGGVTIKWLRHRKGIYSLVPQHIAQEFEVEFLKPAGEFEVVGEVVMWIGQPTPPVKGRK